MNFMVGWEHMGSPEAYAYAGQNGGLQGAELRKALSTGYDLTQPTVAPGIGFALRPQSLDRLLRITAKRAEHIVFWKMLPKGPAFSTVEEYNVMSSYGDDDIGMFIEEGGLPEEFDSTYERKTSQVKYCGVQGRITLPMMMIRPAHGNIIAQETAAKTMKLLELLEMSLFFARSDLDALQFDGLEKLIEDGAGANFIIDMRGQPMSQEAIQDGAVRIMTAGFGLPTHLILSPVAKADLIKSLYPAGRFQIGQSPLQIGSNINNFVGPTGDLQLVHDIFLEMPAAIVCPTTAKGDPSKIPGTPSVSTAVAASSDATAQFSASELGAYYYKAVAVNRYGQSAPVSFGPITPAAAQKITVGLTPGPGPLPKYWKLYRTKVGVAAGSELLIQRTVATGAAQTLTDLNQRIPGCSTAFMIQLNENNIGFKQLSPMMRIPISTIDTTSRWMQLLFGMLQLFTPKRNIIYRNIGRDPGSVDRNLLMA